MCVVFANHVDVMLKTTPHAVSHRRSDILGQLEQARAKDRYRRIALSAMGTGLLSVISILSPIFAAPLCLHHLGAERCGIWMTITSLLAASGFADLGIGSGLTNAVSEAHGRNDRRLACQAVSTATFLLAALAALL